MNEKKETIKDILDGLLSKDSVDALAAIDSAEMIRIMLGHVASLIEAAAEREREAHTNDIHDALYMATGIPGNAAAMREALEDTNRLLKHYAERIPMFADAFAQHIRDNDAALKGETK